MIGEIRRRIAYIGVGVAIVGIEVIREREKVIYMLGEIIGVELREGSIVEVIGVVLRISIWLSIIMSIPMIGVQIYSLVAGGLKVEERKELRRRLIIGVIVIYIGISKIGEVVKELKEYISIVRGEGVVEIGIEGLMKRNYEVIEVVLKGVILGSAVAVIVEVIKGYIRLEKYRKYIIVMSIIVGGIVVGVEVISQIIVGVMIVTWIEIIVVERIMRKQSRRYRIRDATVRYSNI